MQGTGWKVYVIVNNISSAALNFNFTGPTLVSLSQYTGPVVGGTSITVIGTSLGYANSTTLMFGSVSLPLVYTPALLGTQTQARVCL